MSLCRGTLNPNLTCRFVSEKSEELARKSRLDSLERYYAKFCGGTSEMMTRHQVRVDPKP
jgi:hypothetical protein